METDSQATEQLELPLPFPDLSADLPLLPARMVNEYQYCPRLAYLVVRPINPAHMSGNTRSA